MKSHPITPVPYALRRMLRVVGDGIAGDGTYLDNGERRTVTADEIRKLDALAELGYLDQRYRLTVLGRACLEDPGIPTRDTTEPGQDRTTCPSAKVRFGTQAQAAEWLGSYRRRASKGAPKLRAYECPWCSGWHTTKKQKWGTKRPVGSW